MITVVSAFADHAAATSAARRLGHAGFAEAEVKVSSIASAVGNAATLETDELATGGFVGNMVHLLDGLLGKAPPEGDAATYAELVRREGTLVSVRAATPENAAKAREVLTGAGAKAVSTLPQPGLET